MIHHHEDAYTIYYGTSSRAGFKPRNVKKFYLASLGKITASITGA